MSLGKNGSFPRVLMYHAVCDLDFDPYDISISPRAFHSQMSLIRRLGLRGVSVMEYLEARASGSARNLVALTFDDGYSDFLENAVPILKQHDFTATVFVVGGLLGRENVWDQDDPHSPRLGLLDPHRILEVSGAGMEIGSHTMTHARLSKLDSADVTREITQSRQVIGDLIGSEVKGLCYPYGSISRQAVDAAKNAGYSYGCSVFDTVGGDDFDIRRIPVRRKDSIAVFASKLAIYWPYDYAKRVLKLLVGR